MTFTIESPHLLSLLFACVYTIIIFLPFIGYARYALSFSSNNSERADRIPFYLLLAFFPYCLSIISIFSKQIPQIFFYILIILFWLSGTILFIYKYLSHNGINKDSSRTHSCKSYWNNLTAIEKTALAMTVLTLFSKFLSATYFRDEGTIIDATTYHMGGPKEWSTYMNGVIFNTNNPVLFTASYWEYFNYAFVLPFKYLFNYLAPLENTHYEFLCYTLLLTGQMVSAVFGTIIVPLIIYDFFAINKLYAFFAINLIVGIKDLTWVWVLAKNNVYPTFTALLALLIVYKWHKNSHEQNVKNEQKSFYTFATVGILLGISVGAKFTNGYVLPLICLAAIFHYREYIFHTYSHNFVKYGIYIFAGGILGIGAVFLRNYIATNNPVFPMDFFVKNEMLLSAFEAAHHGYSHPSTWDIAINKILDLFKSSPGLCTLSMLTIIFRKYSFTFFLLLIITFNAKITGPLSGWPHKAVLITYLVIGLFLIYDKTTYTTNKIFTFIASKISQKKRAIISIITTIAIIEILSPIHFQNFFKRPFERYFTSLDKNLQGRAFYWEKIKKENIEYRLDQFHVVKDYYGGYFSRFPYVKIDESNPKFQFEYFPENTRNSQEIKGNNN